MRKILFRGQTRRYGEKVRMGDGFKLPSRWVYGGVLQGLGGHSIIYGGENQNAPGEGLDKHIVYTDTLGQYTGLTDKNGVKIFEGDILEYVNGDGTKSHYVVEMCVDVGAWLAKWVEGDGHSSAKSISLLTVIVGNIHDNPELLEVSGDGT